MQESLLRNKPSERQDNMHTGPVATVSFVDSSFALSLSTGGVFSRFGSVVVVVSTLGSIVGSVIVISYLSKKNARIRYLVFLFVV
jgi:hypothetical protein